jgi:hypothetical protein
VVDDAMRRRAKALAGEGNDIGDIAHLEARGEYFAFCSPSQLLFLPFIRVRHFVTPACEVSAPTRFARIASAASAEYSAKALNS